jgi:hypothetical protein
MLKLALPLVLLAGCASDIGLSYTKKEVVEIVGDVAVESREVYDQALDLLLLIDQSCSMSDDIEALENTLPLFYAELRGPDFIDLDWRIGVKSTDPSEGAIESWVAWDDPNIDFKLQALSQGLGSSWQLGGESGLDAAVDSLAWDDEFHREHSDTLIIFMSDEPDQSTITPAGYNSLVSTYKPDPFVVTEGAITVTTLDNRCDTAYDLGTGYLDVSETIVDLCDTEDWLTVLDFVKDHVPTLNEVWPLSLTPLDINSIQVEVDGTPWPHWYYEEAENTVYMTVIPNTGQHVVIAYLVP